MSGIWSACSGPDCIAPLDGSLLRLVESQAQIATSHLGLSLEEQAELESLLETSKPAMPDDARGLHYLLATPFRYPPLPHGSRFARRFEPSLLYGSLHVGTVLAEAAYYRMVFWSGMERAPERGIRTRHTLFNAEYACERGIRLQQTPFDTYRQALTDRGDYRATQALGSAMREAGVQAFEFVSARDAEGGINVALLTPAALPGHTPGLLQDWWAETSASGVSYFCSRPSTFRSFGVAQFLVDGMLPGPAV